MLTNFFITKEATDKFFYELAKEYKKKTRFPLEIIIVGGGVIIINYSFRLMSQDIDALFNYKDDYVKQCIYKVAEKMHIPSDWLNDDFIKSDSYTPKIRQYSMFYKTYSQVLTVRLVEREYLIAMKLVAASTREYKYDHSDIVGVLKEEKNKGNPVTREEINSALMNLYGRLDIVSDEMFKKLDEMLSTEDLETLFNNAVERERQIREELTRLEQQGLVVRRSNIKEIVDMIKDRLFKESKK